MFGSGLTRAGGGGRGGCRVLCLATQPAPILRPASSSQIGARSRYIGGSPRSARRAQPRGHAVVHFQPWWRHPRPTGGPPTVPREPAPLPLPAPMPVPAPSISYFIHFHQRANTPTQHRRGHEKQQPSWAIAGCAPIWFPRRVHLYDTYYIQASLLPLSPCTYTEAVSPRDGRGRPREGMFTRPRYSFTERRGRHPCYFATARPYQSLPQPHGTRQGRGIRSET